MRQRDDHVGALSRCQGRHVTNDVICDHGGRATNDEMRFSCWTAAAAADDDESVTVCGKH